MCYTIVMMNEKVLHIVEFNKIIDQLTENANSEPARTLCRNLKPMDNLPDIRLAQEETDAALQLLIRKGNVNFGSNRDFGYTFGALSIGSTLTAAELLHLSSFLDNVGRVQVYGTTSDGGKGISALSNNGEETKTFTLMDTSLRTTFSSTCSTACIRLRVSPGRSSAASFPRRISRMTQVPASGGSAVRSVSQETGSISSSIKWSM